MRHYVYSSCIPLNYLLVCRLFVCVFLSQSLFSIIFSAALVLLNFYIDFSTVYFY